MTKTKTPFFIAITGGTGSGKSLFSAMVLSYFPDKVLTVSHDMYYKDQSHLPLEDRKKANMDCPDALDNKLFFSHLQKLKNWQEIEMPIYDFTTHTRAKIGKKVSPKEVVIVEGILVFATKYLHDFFDLKIYIEVDADLRLARRIVRDVKERREPTLEGSINQYLESAYPMHYRYVVPQRKTADLVVPWNKKSNEAVETVVSRIEDELEERGVVI